MLNPSHPDVRVVRPVASPSPTDRVRTASLPLGSFGAETALVVGLALVLDVHLLGAAAGVAHAALAAGVIAWGLRRARHRWTAADVVTAARSALAGGVVLLVASWWPHSGADVGTGLVPAAVTTVGLSTVALLLDGVDGRVARAAGTSSRFGARFDVEVDAFLVLVLSVAAAPVVGWWVLAIGLARYAFVAAGAVWPWLRGPLRNRYAYKVVGVTLGVVLIVVVARLVPAATASWLAVLALLALAGSFGHSVAALHRQRAVSDRSGTRSPS